MGNYGVSYQVLEEKKKHVLGFIVWSDDLVGLFK